jgi:hypothetical protein
MSQRANIPLTMSQWANIPLTMSQRANIPLTMSQWANIPLTMSQWANIPLTMSQWTNIPLTMSQQCNATPQWANIPLPIQNSAIQRTMDQYPITINAQYTCLLSVNKLNLKVCTNAPFAQEQVHITNIHLRWGLTIMPHALQCIRHQSVAPIGDGVKTPPQTVTADQLERQRSNGRLRNVLLWVHVCMTRPPHKVLSEV